MVCELCGEEVKKKNPHNTKKEGGQCEKCWDIYIKQNRQMSIETAVYQTGGHHAGQKAS